LKILDLITDISDEHVNELYCDCRNVYALLDTLGKRQKQPVLQGGLGHPMRRYVLPNGMLVTVKDSQTGAWYHPTCRNCNHYPCRDALMALRLTPDKTLQFCLLCGKPVINITEELATGQNAVEYVIRQCLQFYDEAEFQGGDV